jgi:hypothetical protein
MADLLTTATLAKWTQSDAAEVAADPFAADLIEKVSGLICFIGGHDGTKLDASSGAFVPEWSVTPVPPQAMCPIDVQMVALQVIKRSYENPGAVLQEGNVGPLGGDRVTDTQALFLDFTEMERRTIAKYNPDGDPTTGEDSGTIFTIPTTRGDETSLQDATLYVGDNQQVNLEISDDPREWKIPLFNPGDPGDPNNYDEE